MHSFHHRKRVNRDRLDLQHSKNGCVVDGEGAHCRKKCCWAAGQEHGNKCGRRLAGVFDVGPDGGAVRVTSRVAGEAAGRAVAVATR